MANTAQARKRVRQAAKRREHNVALRSRMRTYVKRVLAAIHSQDKETASSAYSEMCKMVDSAAGKGLIHANKAARHKSRLNARIKAI